MYKVMIVDDEAFVCEVIKKIVDWDLLNMEFCCEADNGLSALRLLEEKNPDIVITDIRMPGIDGLEFVKRAKELAPNVAFIIISGHKHFDYARNAIKYDVEDYLLKPVNKKEINRILEQIKTRFEEEDKEKQRSERKEEKLEFSIDRLRTIFLESMLKDNISSNDIHKINKECQCEFGGRYLQSIALRIDKTGKNTLNNDIEEILFILGKAAEEAAYYFEEKNIYMQRFLLDKVIYMVVNLKEKEICAIDFKLLFDRIKKLMERYSEYSCTIGIGRAVEAQTGFNLAIKTSMAAIYERISEGTDRIIYYKNQEESADKEHTFNDLIKSFSKIVELCDGTAITDWLDDAVSFLNAAGYAYEKLLRSEALIESAYKVFADAMKEEIHILKECELSHAKRVYDFLSEEELTTDIKKAIESCFKKYMTFKTMQKAQPVREAKKYISLNYSKDITLEEVAGKVYLNPVYFSVMFKNEEGINFSKYLIDVRINKAKELLKEKRYNISEIARQVGYADHRHFSKLFKKNVGITPNEFRKLNY